MSRTDIHSRVIDDLCERLDGYGLNKDEKRASIIRFIVQLAHESNVVENAIIALDDSY